jgi:hypothetical protein
MSDTARDAEEGSADAQAAASFVSLPRVLQHAILRSVPVDARARCACVHSGWRAAVDEVSLWTRLDLSPSSGVTCTVNDAALRGAAGLARGRLAALDVSGCGDVTHVELLAVVDANATALNELYACRGDYRKLPSLCLGERHPANGAATACA